MQAGRQAGPSPFNVTSAVFLSCSYPVVIGTFSFC